MKQHVASEIFLISVILEPLLSKEQVVLTFFDLQQMEIVQYVGPPLRYTRVTL